MGLMRQDGKRPDGATIIAWSRDKALAWNVMVQDSCAQIQIKGYLLSYNHIWAVQRRKSALWLIRRRPRKRRSTVMSDLSHTHVLYPVAAETAGTWHQQTIELNQEIDRHASATSSVMPEKPVFCFSSSTCDCREGMRSASKEHSPPPKLL